MTEAFTFQEWVDTAPDVYAMSDEQIQELRALFEPVKKYLEDNNIPAHFTFIAAIMEDLSSTQQGITIIPSVARSVPEILLMANMSQNGLQGAVDVFDPLIDSANERLAKHKPRIVLIH